MRGSLPLARGVERRIQPAVRVSTAVDFQAGPARPAGESPAAWTSAASPGANHFCGGCVVVSARPRGRASQPCHPLAGLEHSDPECLTDTRKMGSRGPSGCWSHRGSMFAFGGPQYACIFPSPEVNPPHATTTRRVGRNSDFGRSRVTALKGWISSYAEKVCDGVTSKI